jgi:hypothetical protein
MFSGLLASVIAFSCAAFSTSALCLLSSQSLTASLSFKLIPSALSIFLSSQLGIPLNIFFEVFPSNSFDLLITLTITNKKKEINMKSITALTNAPQSMKIDLAKSIVPSAL